MSLNELISQVPKSWADVRINSIQLDKSTSQLIFGTGITVTAPAPVSAQSFVIPDVGVASAIFEMGVQRYNGVSSNTTLGQAQSGLLCLLGATTGATTVILPAPTPGLQFDVLVSTATLGNDVKFDAGAGLLAGHICSCDAKSNTSATASRYITLATATAVLGDRVRLVGSGTKWLAEAVVSVQNGAAFS